MIKWLVLGFKQHYFAYKCNLKISLLCTLGHIVRKYHGMNPQTKQYKVLRNKLTIATTMQESFPLVFPANVKTTLINT